jgi:hypothetical protein
LLPPAAILTRQPGFDKGSNAFGPHSEFPISYRQDRRFFAKDKKAGLQISTNEMGTKADIDIDFAFLLHLAADNSNVQAGNNYQRFKNRYHIELQTVERILKGQGGR